MRNTPSTTEAEITENQRRGAEAYAEHQARSETTVECLICGDTFRGDRGWPVSADGRVCTIPCLRQYQAA